MLKKPERTCEDHATTILKVACWNFCKIFNAHFGNKTLVLKEEGVGGENISLSITSEWLYINNVAKSKICQVKSVQFILDSIEHMKTCPSPQCLEANVMLYKISHLLMEGKLPGAEALVMESIYQEKEGDPSQVILCRKRGFGDSIDWIMPFVKCLLGKNRNLWEWPGEEENCSTDFHEKSK